MKRRFGSLLFVFIFSSLFAAAGFAQATDSPSGCDQVNAFFQQYDHLCARDLGNHIGATPKEAAKIWGPERSCYILDTLFEDGMRIERTFVLYGSGDEVLLQIELDPETGQKQVLAIYDPGEKESRRALRQVKKIFRKGQREP